MIRAFIVEHIHGLVNAWPGGTQKVLYKTAWLGRFAFAPTLLGMAIPSS
jgi:hypothetical protein